MSHTLESRVVHGPLHLTLVHFPIVLFLLATGLDVMSLVSDRHAMTLSQAGLYSGLAGVAMGLLAALTGLKDFRALRRDHPARGVAFTHAVLNAIVIAVYATCGLARSVSSLTPDPAAPVWAVASEIAALLVLGYSGYLGGKLVYEDGVGVGRHRHLGSLPAETRIICFAGGQSHGTVGSSESLPEGGTLRVCADHTVIALARSEQQVFACQEFCPHRFGPLSEGRVEGGKIVCPWHGSTFSLSDGKVLHGPAKTGLRTFFVEDRGGQLRLRRPGGTAG